MNPAISSCQEVGWREDVTKLIKLKYSIKVAGNSDVGLLFVLITKIQNPYAYRGN